MNSWIPEEPHNQTPIVYDRGGSTGGAGGAAAPPPPQPEHWGGIAPNFRLQYKEVPKSPLLSLFCNSVYWLKPHNNVNSRPPNLEVLPLPLYDAIQTCIIKFLPLFIFIRTLSSSGPKSVRISRFGSLDQNLGVSA